MIIIIGILATIAFVAYSGSQSKAKKSAAQSTIEEVRSKLGEYYAANNSFPATITDIDNWMSSNAGGNNSGVASAYTTANGYSYSVTPSGCGDTVASGGVVTAGSSVCNNFAVTALATIWNDSNSADNITLTE